jgi:hypothetical protein
VRSYSSGQTPETHSYQAEFDARVVGSVVVFLIPAVETWFGLDGQRGQQRPVVLAFQPHHTMIEPRLNLAIRAGSDVACLNCATKFIDCLPNYL